MNFEREREKERKMMKTRSSQPMHRMSHGRYQPRSPPIIEIYDMEASEYNSEYSSYSSSASSSSELAQQLVKSHRSSSSSASSSPRSSIESTLLYQSDVAFDEPFTFQGATQQFCLKIFIYSTTLNCCAF